MNRKDFFKNKVKLYKKDLTLFATEVLGFEPDEWQKKVFEDLSNRNRVSVKSGQGVGKTAVESASLLWFLTCFPYARVVATAPTQRQLYDVLWAEVHKWQQRSPILCELLRSTKTYFSMKNYEQRWFATARTATKPENMQGFHEDNMLFIVDEASGVPDMIMEAILGTLTGKNNKLLLCGNPTKPSGTFYDSHTTDRELYACHTVDSSKSKRTNKDSINSLIKKYGEDSNVVRVRVKGEFPTQEDDVFIPISLIEQSIMTEWQVPKKVSQIHIAADIARFGDDVTVIGYRIDEKIKFHKKIKGQDTMRTAKDIAILGLELAEKYRFKGSIPVKIDDGGVGGGVTDRLRELKENEPYKYEWLDVYPIHFGQKIKHKYFDDSTSYMMSIVKDLLSPHDKDGKPKDIELILPNDSGLVAQLSTRKYSITDKSKIRIESKEKVKKRGQPSPDEADCVLLLCLPIKQKRKRGVEKDEQSSKETAGKNEFKGNQERNKTTRTKTKRTTTKR